MSMRLVDADALKSEMKEILKDDESGCARTLGSLLLVVIESCIDGQPTVEERKKGKWLLDDKSGRYRCSECLSVASRDDHGAEVLSDYCGVCGAEMEKA